MSSAPSSRASLLAGLRTGGVRSASQPAVPQTAAPGGSFNVPRLASFSGQHIPEDEADELADMVSHNLHLNGGRRMMQPMTASAADGMGNRFQMQQQQAVLLQMAAQRAALNGIPLGGMNGMGVDPVQAQAQLQMQVMQMEIMKLQALHQAQQVQQFQSELVAQAQRQQAQQQRPVRRGSAFNEPATAGPLNTSFPSSQVRVQADEYKVNGNEDVVPMTAALGGKFGSRSLQSGLNPNANVFTSRVELEDANGPKSQNSRTTVISGGTPLGATISPSKSDSALSWRRGGPVLPTNNGRSVSGSPSVKITPPNSDDVPQAFKGRPEPLRFNGAIPGSIPTVSIENVEYEEGNDSDNSYSSDIAQFATFNGADADGRESSPGTPPSAGSSNSLSAREEASKRLYEGLGIGRPAAHNPVPPVTAPPQRHFSQPLRQPRGPPASVDELGSRNFASRLQMKVVIGEF